MPVMFTVASEQSVVVPNGISPRTLRHVIRQLMRQSARHDHGARVQEIRIEACRMCSRTDITELSYYSAKYGATLYIRSAQAANCCHVDFGDRQLQVFCVPDSEVALEDISLLAERFRERLSERIMQNTLPKKQRRLRFGNRRHKPLPL